MTCSYTDMDLIVPKASHREVPSMSGALDLRDTDISDDMESLFPNNFGTSMKRSSRTVSKTIHTPIENHRTFRAWGRKTFGRNKAFVFDRSDASDASDASNPPERVPIVPAMHKTRPRIHRRKSLSSLVHTMAAMISKDSSSDEPHPAVSEGHPRVSSTISVGTAAIEDFAATTIHSPVEYLPKTREKSECSSTFRNGVDDAVKLITGSGLDIGSRSEVDAGAWGTMNTIRGAKTPLATPAASIFELPGAISSRVLLSDEQAGNLITLVLPPDEDDTQCDAYHLYRHELFAFLGACPPAFSMLGIYDAARRVYYLQPPTAFDEAMGQSYVPDHQLDEYALKTLPAGLRRFLADLPTGRSITDNGMSTHRAITKQCSLGVETEPAMKKKLRSDITEILRLLAAHQKDVTNQILTRSGKTSEIELLRGDVHKRLAQAVDTISQLMDKLKPTDSDESEQVVEGADNGPSADHSASDEKLSFDQKTDEWVTCVDGRRPQNTKSSQEDSWPIHDRPRSGKHENSVIEDLQGHKLCETSPCKAKLQKVNADEDALFVVDPKLLAHRTRVPREDSDEEDSLNGIVRRKRNRTGTSTGPFFTGSWRHESRAGLLSPFRAARLGKVRGSEGSEAISDASAENVEECAGEVSHVNWNEWLPVEQPVDQPIDERNKS